MIDKTVDVDIENPRLKARALYWEEIPNAQCGDIMEFKIPFTKPDAMSGEFVVIIAERVPIPITPGDIEKFVRIRRAIG